MKLMIFFGLIAHFSFAAVAHGAIHFAVIGDYGQNNEDEARVADLIKRHNPRLILTTGDNNYPHGCKDTIDANIGKYYHSYIYNYQGSYGEGSPTRRFYPSLGNHDWYAVEKCNEPTGLPYISYFDLPGNERYYDFVEGSVHFFALDSDSHEPDGAKPFFKQYHWLRDRVRASTSVFKIAYFHHPPFSSGEHGNSLNMQWRFDKLGIDVVIAGHDHNYERILKDDIVYIVNGLGGARPRPIKKLIPGSKLFYHEKHGALFIEADHQRMRINFKTHDDIVIDDYVIEKNADQQRPEQTTKSLPKTPCQRPCAI